MKFRELAAWVALLAGAAAQVESMEKEHGWAAGMLAAQSVHLLGTSDIWRASSDRPAT